MAALFLGRGVVMKLVVADAGETVKRCKWCEDHLLDSKRADAIFCSTRCRQCHFRFVRYGSGLASGQDPIRVAYADPPYPNKSHLYAGRADYGGEVDHKGLCKRLCRDFPSGFALSTSARALPQVLRYLPTDVRVCCWVRGARNTRGMLPANAYEPVLVFGGRESLRSDRLQLTDTLVHACRARRADPRRCLGSKPAAFIFWLFGLLGLRAGDELVDLFPGSGRVGYAFEHVGGLVVKKRAPRIAQGASGRLEVG